MLNNKNIKCEEMCGSDIFPKKRILAAPSPNHIKRLQDLPSTKKKMLAKFVNQMVATAYEVTGDHLFNNARGNSREIRARQISMYLMHICLSFSLTEIARIYARDRTTIGHACRVIEDMRDTPVFDDRIIEMEETIQTVIALATNYPIKHVGDKNARN